MELDIGKGRRGGFEPDSCAGDAGNPDLRQGSIRYTVTVDLFIHFAFTANCQNQLLRKGVHHRNPDAVQATGHLVGVIVEFPPRVQHGHDDLCRRNALLMHLSGYAAAIIPHGYGLIRVYGYGDFTAVAGKCFIDRVVDQLEHHMVQAGTVIRIPDVHARAFSHGIQSFKNLDTG